MKTKNIIKEIIIVLLLILAIILILGILLYEYVPNNKIIPQQVSYTTPESTSENVDDSQIIMTYEVTATDLTNYKKTKDYVSGKKNPFESINSQNTTTENTTTGSNGGSETAGSSTGTTSTNTTTDSTQEGYLPDKGTK